MPKSRSPLARFARMVRTGKPSTPSGPTRVGVDLGTGNIVLAAVDGDNSPLAGASISSTVVRLFMAPIVAPMGSGWQSERSNRASTTC